MLVIVNSLAQKYERAHLHGRSRRRSEALRRFSVWKGI